MQIHGLQQSQATQAIQRTSTQQRPENGSQAANVHSSPVDQVEFSPEAQQILQSQSAGEAQAAEATDGIRVGRVAEIRQAIADGSYETPEKLDAALDRLLDSFA